MVHDEEDGTSVQLSTLLPSHLLRPSGDPPHTRGPSGLLPPLVSSNSHHAGVPPPTQASLAQYDMLHHHQGIPAATQAELTARPANEAQPPLPEEPPPETAEGQWSPVHSERWFKSQLMPLATTGASRAGPDEALHGTATDDMDLEEDAPPPPPPSPPPPLLSPLPLLPAAAAQFPMAGPQSSNPGQAQGALAGQQLLAPGAVPPVAAGRSPLPPARDLQALGNVLQNIMQNVRLTPTAVGQHGGPSMQPFPSQGYGGNPRQGGTTWQSPAGVLQHAHSSAGGFGENPPSGFNPARGQEVMQRPHVAAPQPAVAHQQDCSQLRGYPAALQSPGYNQHVAIGQRGHDMQQQQQPPPPSAPSRSPHHPQGGAGLLRSRVGTSVYDSFHAQSHGQHRLLPTQQSRPQGPVALAQQHQGMHYQNTSNALARPQQEQQLAATHGKTWQQQGADAVRTIGSMHGSDEANATQLAFNAYYARSVNSNSAHLQGQVSARQESTKWVSHNF